MLKKDAKINGIIYDNIIIYIEANYLGRKFNNNSNNNYLNHKPRKFTIQSIEFSDNDI